MSDPTPDPRATLELCEKIRDVLAGKRHDIEQRHALLHVGNKLPAIIRDLRRLAEVEAELERTRVSLHNYVAAADAEATFTDELNADAKELQAEILRLRAALKPFADRAESLRQLASDLDCTEARVCGIQPVAVQNLIAAAEALAHREGQ